MIRFALKGMAGRKLRTALTALAIVLGVTMVSGTFVLTDSIDKAFDSIFSSVYQGTDATITGKSAFDLSDGSGTTAPPFDESLQPKVEALPDVAAAIGGVAGEAQLIGKDGKAIVFGGAPNLGFSVDPTQPDFNTLTLEEGAWPGRGRGRDRCLDGVEEGSLGRRHDRHPGRGAGRAVHDLRARQVRLRRHDRWRDARRVQPADGPASCSARSASSTRSGSRASRASRSRSSSPRSTQILPPGTQVRTGAEQAAEDAKDTDEFISFLRYFLLAFGVIALFVGAFVIFNSLSITIAQRTRELATLRTLGASRRQVRFSVIVESLVMGTLASIVGLFLGSRARDRACSSSSMRSGSRCRTAASSSARGRSSSRCLLGIIVTLIASILPAFKATRVPPIAAVREGATIAPGRFARFRTPIAARDHGARVRRPALGAVRARPRDDPDPALHDPRDGAGVHRRRDALGPADPRPHGHPRLARRDVRRGRGRARARQRPSEPAAHRLNRGRADDRARARHARRDPGRERGADVHRCRERDLRRRLRDHGPEQLLADPDRRGRGRRQGARCRRGRQRPHGRDARLRLDRVLDGRRPGCGRR